MPENSSTFNAAINLIESDAPIKAPDKSALRRFDEQMLKPKTGFQTPEMAMISAIGSIPSAERLEKQKFIAQERQMGVPLDVDEGLPAGIRAKMSFERNPQKRAEWLANQPGIEGVRMASDGNSIIARVKDERGDLRDILVDERRMTMRDFADIAGDLPQVAVGALLAYLTGGTSLPLQIGATAGGTAAAGAAQDIAVRAGSGREVDLPEIAKERGIQTGIDAALMGAPAAGKRLAEIVVGPFSKGVGPLEVAAKEAASKLNIPLTASQLTGSKAVARVEQFTKELPLGGPLVEQSKAQDDAVRRVRDFLVGAPPEKVPTSADIAERAGSAIAEKREMRESVMALKERGAQKTAEGELEAVLQRQLPVGPVTPSQAGKSIRSRVIALRDDFKKRTEEAYGKVYSLEGANEPFIGSAPVKTLVDDIQKASTEATAEILPEIRRIFKVGEAIPDNMTLRQATELRSVIGDMLGRPEALPGIPEGYLKRLYGAVSESIEQGVKNAPNPEIGKALKDAQDLYKREFFKFEQPGVKDLFLEAAPGRGFQVGDAQVAQRIVSGKGNVDQLRVYKELLGEGSTEYQGLLRSAVTDIMDSSRFGNDFVDAGEFLSKLKGMSPEFRKEAIGPIEKELVDNAKLLGLAQGKKVSVDDMERILNSRPGKVASVVRDVIEEQADLDKYYSSALMKQLTDGRFNPASLNPDEFVARFVENASAQDLKQVMTQLRALDKELPEMIRKRSMLDLLNRASSDLTPEDKLFGDISRYSEDKLRGLLTGPSGEKYKTLLGAEAMDTLQDLMTVEASREKARSMAKASGQLVYSNILAALMDFRFSEVPRIIKNRILAGALTTPGVRGWLVSQQKIPATPKLRQAVMTAPPMIRAIIGEFSDEPDTLGQVFEMLRVSPDMKQETGMDSAMKLIDSSEGDEPRK